MMYSKEIEAVISLVDTEKSPHQVSGALIFCFDAEDVEKEICEWYHRGRYIGNGSAVKNHVILL
jgi:hypothetical protein